MAAAAMMDLLLDPVRAVKLLRGMSEREYDASGFQPNPALAVATYLVVGGSLDEARVAVDELAAAWAASPATDDEAVRFMQAALAERNA